MFENKLIGGIHATRYIMSWVREGGKLGRRGEGVDDFRKWLSLQDLDDEEIYYIINLAQNGKMELESSAKRFLDKNKTK